MTTDRTGSAVVEFPSELEVLVTREFDAPIQLVFDVFTKPEHVEAVETVALQEAGGVTRLAWTLAFRDQAGRAHMTKYDGIEANFENVAKYLQSLLDVNESAAQ